jgi:rhodanese-related sulfurtransferase
MHRHASLAALFGPALALLALACTHSPELKTLTVDEVAARIAAHDGKTFVFDDNPQDRFQKGHVPGAHWVSGREPTAAELPADKGALLVFYCASEL